MRICLLANARSTHTRRWAQAYAERGHETHVLSIRDAEIPGVAVHRVAVGGATSAPATALSYLRLGLVLRRRLRALAPDVLHAAYAPTHGALAAFAGWHPWLLSVWGSDVVGVAERGWALRRWTRRAVAAADRVCATGRFLAAEVERLCPRPVGLTPFGVDVERFRPPAGGRAAADDGRFTVGFVKTLAPRYGADVLLRAMARFVDDVPRARLVMVGRDETDGGLARLAADLGLGDRVELPGFVPHQELPALLAGFDVFANPSVCAESFGVSILEASACGVPVVASDTGGIPEVCRHGETGLLVPPGDPAALAAALGRLAADAALGRRLGDAGRRFVVATYRWEDCVDRMLAELEALASPPPSAEGGLARTIHERPWRKRAECVRSGDPER